jgi:hypothetical protein
MFAKDTHSSGLYYKRIMMIIASDICTNIIYDASKVIHDASVSDTTILNINYDPRVAMFLQGAQ